MFCGREAPQHTKAGPRLAEGCPAGCVRHSHMATRVAIIKLHITTYISYVLEYVPIANSTYKYKRNNRYIYIE